MLHLLTMLNWFLLIDPALPRPHVCNADKHTNGCSVPLGINAPYKKDFTPACNKHDICYGCVSAYFDSSEMSYNIGNYLLIVLKMHDHCRNSEHTRRSMSRIDPY